MTFYEHVLQQFKMEKADFFANFRDTRKTFAQNGKSLKATVFQQRLIFNCRFFTVLNEIRIKFSIFYIVSVFSTDE
jgi:hypothetical protein